MFGKELNQQYRAKMEGVLNFVDDYTKRLARPIRDLEDVREAMSALNDIRENQIALDMQLGPIEVLSICRILNWLTWNNWQKMMLSILDKLLVNKR